MKSFGRPALAAIIIGATVSGCRAPATPIDPGSRRGEEIRAAGRLFSVGTRVVLWNDPGGYDAYSRRCRFDPSRAAPRDAPDRLARFGSQRGSLPADVALRVKEQGWSIEDLRRVVSQVVVHFDACGTSRRCFEVLHDIRGLSCHFLLDLDGTIYQTLDLKERAWHASQANERSIGIEIANVGAYADAGPLARWFTRDANGSRMIVPPADRGELPADFVARPSRATPARGRVQGKDLIQYDFTEEQYVALGKLLAALCAIFPRIEPEAPRGDDGRILDRAFASDDELHAFHGIIGHWHVTTDKVDPGPAFDWERVITAARGEATSAE
jgi:N-acetylmuramoyl-L-alanine amidase